MGSLSNLRKKLGKRKNILTGMNDPTRWISTGNAALNYALTGRIDVGLCNRRPILFWGQSGTGKTFLTSNLAKNAQAEGYKIIYIDTEDSIHEDYMEKVGIDLSEEMFIPVIVSTIEACTEALSEIFDEFGEEDKFILIIDSLAGMLSEKEMEEFTKGTTKGDMGQTAKKLKLLVKNINHKISKCDAFCVMVTHAYQNQDLLNGEGNWICTGGKGFQFFPSFSVRLDKAILKDKNEEGDDIDGVRIKACVTKTRFTAPNKKLEMKVPYNTGLNYSDGICEVLLKEKVITKNGGWFSYEYKGQTVKFQRSSVDDHLEALIEIHSARIGGIEDVKESEDYETEEEADGMSGGDENEGGEV